MCVNFVNADVRLESSMFSITFDGQKLESEVLHSNGSLSPRPLSSRAINTSALSQGALSQGALIVTDTYVQVGPLGRVRYEIANVSDGVVDLGTVNITVNTRLSADEDAKAGLGASFYAYLHPFLVNAESGQANTIDISKLPATQKSVMQEPGAKHPSMKDPATKGPSTKDPELKQRDWFGWDNRYQLEAIRFTGDTEALRLGYSGDDINSSGSPLPADIYAQLTPGQVQPGGVVIIEFDYLFGVKSRALLNDPGLNLEGLLLRNLWHWVRAVCFVFWDLLDYLYALCGNWGLSIIVLAFIVRLLTLPVTKMSLRYQERS
ncbi:MAG: hypothetical protein KUG75_08285, partial [Pseudomonadales bacterium]|nr:hypothetical protein [Pseudomonadales bacterium]